MKQRLIVDMDGVLADVYEQFLNYEESETGFRQPLENLYGKPEHVAFKNGGNYVLTKNFSEMPLLLMEVFKLYTV